MSVISFDLEKFTGEYADVSEFENVADALLKDERILAGGAVRRAVAGSDPFASDFDLFFHDEEAMEACNVELSEKGTKVRSTKNSSTFKVEIADVKDVEVNTVGIAWFEDDKTCIESFDFTACMFAYRDGFVTTTPEALWDLGRKRLRVHKITYPIASMRRMLKYTKQGFFACDGCMKALITEGSKPEVAGNMSVTYVD